MAIIKPQLPPKKGYVEVEINGVRTYRNVETIKNTETNTFIKIAELKAQLEASDYKIIKCYEAQLVDEELPYDIITLHAERQAIRDQINELEGGN